MYLELIGNEKIDKNFRLLNDYLVKISDENTGLKRHIKSLEIEIGNLKRDLRI